MAGWGSSFSDGSYDFTQVEQLYTSPGSKHSAIPWDPYWPDDAPVLRHKIAQPQQPALPANPVPVKPEPVPEQKKVAYGDAKAKKMCKILSKESEFRKYFDDLSKDQQELAQSIIDQLSNFNDGCLHLPDNDYSRDMIPLPSCITPAIPSSSTSVVIQPGQLANFASSAAPVKNRTILMPAWPSASSLKELNKHHNVGRTKEEILMALDTAGNESPRAFGFLIAKELEKIPEGQRVAVAKSILAVLSAPPAGSISPSEEPEAKRRRPSAIEEEGMMETSNGNQALTVKDETD